MWFEDPCFDTFEEAIDGKSLRGDEWRSVMAFKETCPKVSLIEVAGITFNQTSLKRAREMPGSCVQLVREPENKFDKDAIRVEINEQPVGYIPKSKNKTVSLKRAAVTRWGLEPKPHVLLAVES